MTQQPTNALRLGLGSLLFSRPGTSSVNELPRKIQLFLGLRQVPFLDYLKYRRTVPRPRQPAIADARFEEVGRISTESACGK